MATLDQLPAEQRAIIELVVQRGRSYDDLADVLGMSSSRVRELAHEALIELAPVTAARVDGDRRGQIADYVLDQQSRAERTATQTHLKRSEAGRTWTASLVDSLGHMYDGGPPEIPEAEAEAPSRRRERQRPRERERARERRPAREREPAREPEPAAERERPPSREPVRRPRREPLRRPAAALSPEAAAAVRRRRIIGAGVAAAVVAAIVIGVIALSGGSDKKAATPTTARRGQARILGELLLQPVNKSNSTSQGIAIVANRGTGPELIVQAKLPPTKQGQAYEVWLFNSRKNAVPVGAQVTDQKGNYQGAGKLPADITQFKAIDVSLQPIPNPACQRNPACLRRSSAHSGVSVLRGLVADMRRPSQTSTGTTPGGLRTTGP